MRIHKLLVVAATLGVVTSSATLAQQAGDEAETSPPVADEAIDLRPDPDREITPGDKLDSLFDLLAEADEKQWEALQAQIRRLWNQSGSASMDLLAMRADRAMEAEDFETALVHLNDLTRLAPDFAEGWNKRATVYFLQDDYARSLEDIARTLRLEPRHFGALSGLGIILDRVGDPKGALEAYRRAVRIHPHLPGAHEGIKKLTPMVEGERL